MHSAGLIPQESGKKIFHRCSRKIFLAFDRSIRRSHSDRKPPFMFSFVLVKSAAKKTWGLCWKCVHANRLEQYGMLRRTRKTEGHVQDRGSRESRLYDLLLRTRTLRPRPSRGQRQKKIPVFFPDKCFSLYFWKLKGVYFLAFFV